MAEKDAAVQQPQCGGDDVDAGPRAARIDFAPEGPAPISTSEEAAPMLEAHAPHKAIHTWTDFFVHIATIVIGLVIAVGLEQTVELLHHRHQRLQLEEQIHAVLEKNVQLVAIDTQSLDSFRSYLVEMQQSVAARRQGMSTPAAPTFEDARSATILNIPGIAPYEAAKQNGTVALLSSNQIRIYNRIDSSLVFFRNDLNRFNDALAAVDAFNDRFNPASRDYAFIEINRLPDLALLSLAELTEYQGLIGGLINATDGTIGRLGLFDAEIRAVLRGVRDDNEFIDVLTLTLRSHSKLNRRPPTTH